MLVITPKLMVYHKVIKKWYNVTFNGKKDLGGKDCAFCLYYANCCTCPIGKYTKRPQCQNTPYKAWAYWCLRYECNSTSTYGFGFKYARAMYQWLLALPISKIQWNYWSKV